MFNSLLMQKEQSSILKMRAYKKKKFEHEMGHRAKARGQVVFDRTCQKVAEIMEFKSETEDWQLKDTNASALMLGTTDRQDERLEIDTTTARVQFGIGGAVEEAAWQEHKRHSKSVMESYGSANPSVPGKYPQPPRSSRKIDHKFRNQGYLNLQNKQSPGTRQRHNKMTGAGGSADRESLAQTQNAMRSSDCSFRGRGAESHHTSILSSQQHRPAPTQISTQRPYEDQGEVPQPGPYRPAHLKYLGSHCAREAVKEAVAREELAKR